MKRSVPGLPKVQVWDQGEVRVGQADPGEEVNLC